MQGRLGPKVAIAVYRMSQRLRRPENLAFLPALTLAAFWLGGEEVLILTALGLPLIYLMTGAFGVSPAPPQTAPRDGETGLVLRQGAVDMLDPILANATRSGQTTACLVLYLDESRGLVAHHGHAAHAEVLRRTADRLRGALRGADIVARLDGDGFAVALAPVARADLESVLQLAARLQSVVTAPIALDASRLYITASVGFCLAGRAPEQRGASLLRAAELAAEDAIQNGPGAIRAWSPAMQRVQADRDMMRAEIGTALDNGQIVPFFQPQISTDTGEITGFEALARWQHPERGLVPPGEFLPLIEQAGLSDRLCEVVLFRALRALRHWDEAGLDVPTVAVNFSREELRNPRLPEKLKWELDRFELTPARLTVEILETVVAETDNDVIVRNIAELARMGFGIDLDDFGTGHASIANIRRFAVRRLKIDRSFVTRMDEDPGQQAMVAAILSMAERLGLDTLAEGVETTGEHALLAQLGCGHVQGFGIGRPMAFEATAEWIARHHARRPIPPQISHRAG